MKASERLLYKMDARVGEWLTNTTKRLTGAEISTPRLDSLVLLEDVTARDRSWLLAHPEHFLSEPELGTLNTAIMARIEHVPLAYIRGKAEFYGRDFIVNSHTLVPRPETETIIDLLKQLQPLDNASILDIGTGSGCIAITTALELPGVEISACDIDSNCLDVAIRNANVLGAVVSFFKSDLLTKATECEILVANLPYVPDGFEINTAATHEPRSALFGGADGLNLYRRLFAQVQTWETQPRYILTESLPSQHDALTVIAKVAGFALRKTDDFIQMFNLIS